MRITPGPGTVVVIVQRDSEANVVRVGRMTGRAGAISADLRPDLPEIAPAAFVVLLAKVANQKMMAEGVYSGERDGQDNFHITRSWAPSDNRRDPRLPVRVKAEVRQRGSRGTIPAVICDLSAGGAKIEVESDALRGEIDLLIRYGGFSATLPAFVLGNDDDEEDESGTSGPDEEPSEAEVSGESGEDSESSAAITALTGELPPTGESTPGEGAGSHEATPGEPETEITSEAEEAPADTVPEQQRRHGRLERIVHPTIEVRLMFDDLDLPQQGFLRHMLREVAEISGWELAS